MPAMPLTLEDLDRRVAALERTQNDTTETLRWVVAKLARVQAVQDEHTLRLERIETKLEDHDRRFDAVDGRLDRLEKKFDNLEKKVDNLAAAIPGLVAGALREVLSERKS